MVSNYAAFYAGNFIVSLVALEKVLKKCGISVSYVFPKNAPFSNWSENGKFAENHDVITSDFTPDILASNLRNLVKDENIIVHFHFLDWKTLIAVKGSLQEKHCSMVLQEHMRANFVEEQKHWGVFRAIKTHIKKLLYKYSTTDCKVIGVSDAVYDDLCAIRGEKETYLVRNAVSTKRLDGNWDNLLSLDPALDVVIFGTHFERKGVDIALKAVKIAGNDIRLVVLTHNEDDAVKRLDEIYSDWRKFAIVEHVVENVPTVYNHSLCFISPSRSEAFGYAVAEAAYCNTQVIASDVPGQNSMKCIPGIQWVRKECVDELAKALVNCYEMRQNYFEELQRQNEIQKDYVSKNFGLDKWCDEIIEVYGVK